MKQQNCADGKSLKITKFDIIVICLLIIIPLFYIAHQPNGNKKLFLISGNEKKEIQLKDQIIKLNNGDVVIEVTKDGARFIENNCPGNICVKTGWAERCGQTVACVPNRLALVIECEKEAFDAVSR